jgi:hypothetical protein
MPERLFRYVNPWRVRVCRPGLERDWLVTSAAPIVAYMAKQRWTRGRVQDYCRRRGSLFQAIA